MPTADKVQLLLRCARDSRTAMREWALLWRWALTPQLRSRALSRARESRAAGEYYMTGARKMV